MGYELLLKEKIDSYYMQGIKVNIRGVIKPLNFDLTVNNHVYQSSQIKLDYI